MFNYSELVNESIEAYYIKEEQELIDIKIPSRDFESITDYINYSNWLKVLLVRINSKNATEITIDMEDRIRNSFSSRMEEYNTEMGKLIIGHKQNKTRVREGKELKIKEANLRLESYVENEKSKLSNLKTKHSSIVTRRSEIEKIFRLYGIPINSVTIDLEAMDVNELIKVIDSSSYILDEILESPKIISKAVSLLYLPATVEHKDETSESTYKLVWLLIMLVLLLLTKGVFLAIFGILYTFNLFINILDINKRKHALELAYSITSDIDFDKFYIMTDEYANLMQEIDKANSIDIQPELDRLDAEYNTELIRVQEHDPSNDIQELLENYRRYVNGASVVRVIDTYKKMFYEIKDQKIVECNEEMKRVEYIINDHIENYNYLGRNIEESKILKPYARCGAIYYEDKIILEKKINFPYRSTIFSYKDRESKTEVIDYMKLMLLNHLCNVNPTNTFVTVIDEIEGGSSVVEFINKDYSRFTKLVTDEVKETIDRFTEVMNGNVLRSGSNSIDEYNEIAVRDGKLLITYDICIVMNSTSDFLSDAVFRKRMLNSHERGVVFWIFNDETNIDPADAMGTKRLEDSKRGLQEVIGFNKIKDVDRNLVPIDMEEFVNYKYNPELSKRVLSNLAAYCKSARSDSLIYETGFRQKYIPDEKVWTYDTIKGIEMNFGLEDGDPDKPNTISFGDKNVHAISVGMTGAGKSGMINAAIASLVHRYSPEWLEMVMIDFKNIEFAKYTGDYCLPHAKIISGTKDGSYALSIFDYLIKEQKRRMTIAKNAGFDNTSDYNSWVVKNKKYDLIIPRILCVFDEFQAMFNQVDSKLLTKITTKMAQITKEARFVGIHFWFTSQSMTGTLGSDLLGNFNLRSALRCKKEVSESVLGNSASATISENVMGWMYTNQSAGENENSNQLWRIPWADSEYMKVYLTKLNNKCRDEINPDTGKHWLHRHADFYDEDEIFGKSKLDNWLADSRLQDPRVFVVGERMEYSTMRSPINRKVYRGENENILFASFEMDSMVNIANTFIENLTMKGLPIVVNVPDEDTCSLMGLRDRIPEDTVEFLNYSGEEIQEYVLECIEARRQLNLEDLKPSYIIGINWEMLEGFGRNNYKTKDKWIDVMRKANSVDIHFITCVMQYTEIRSNFSSLYKHKIGSYMSDAESFYVCGDGRLNTFKKENAMYIYGSSEAKFKIYDFPIYGEVKEREVMF